MRICTKAFHVPKHGNAEEEYEDAFFPEKHLDRKAKEFRCAVADGASESAFSGHWAQLLVHGFGRRRLLLGHLQQTWQKAVKSGPLPWYLEKKFANGAHAAFVGLMLRDGFGSPSGNGAAGGGMQAAPPPETDTAAPGADAPPARGKAGTSKKKTTTTKKKKTTRKTSKKTAKTTTRKKKTTRTRKADAPPAGGSPAPDEKQDKDPVVPDWLPKPEAPAPKPGGRWRAFAVGDSCLFQVRADDLLVVGPLCRSDDFDNAPYLISSRDLKALRRHREHLSIAAGLWEPGDVFYLATDAIAQWLLAENEAGRPPWPLLGGLASADDPELFKRLVDELRQGKCLRNDDTTLLQIEVA